MAWSLTQSWATSAGQVAAGVAGEGPPLVLVHGWPWSSYAWSRLIPALAERFEVHWYDMPGYGRSEMRADQATGLDVQGAVLAELLDQWGLTRPMVFAHDIGGAVALRAHLLGGVAFDRLLLMNIVALRPWGSAFFDHVGRHVEAFIGLPPHIHEAVARAYISGALATGLPEEDLEALAAPWLTEAGRVSFYRQFAQADEAFTAAFEPHLGRIGCPVAVLWRALDPWIPLERGRALAEQIPQAGLTVLPGAGHLPQLESPQATVREALTFLAA